MHCFKNLLNQIIKLGNFIHDKQHGCHLQAGNKPALFHEKFWKLLQTLAQDFMCIYFPTHTFALASKPLIIWSTLTCP